MSFTAAPRGPSAPVVVFESLAERDGWERQQQRGSTRGTEV